MILGIRQCAHPKVVCVTQFCGAGEGIKFNAWRRRYAVGNAMLAVTMLNRKRLQCGLTICQG